MWWAICASAIAANFTAVTEREREMFYLTTHSRHFIYGYMASDIWLRTILIVRKETRCCHIGYSCRGAVAGTRNSSMGPPWRIDPLTHRTMSERSYHGARSRSFAVTETKRHYYIMLLKLYRTIYISHKLNLVFISGKPFWFSITSWTAVQVSIM